MSIRFVGCLFALVACGQPAGAPVKNVDVPAAPIVQAPTATASTLESPPPQPPTASPPQADAPQVERPFELLVGESKPLAPTPQPYRHGSLDVSAELCTLSDGNPLSPSNMAGLFSAVRVVGDHVVVISGHGHAIKFYRIEKGSACKLTLDVAIGNQGTLAPQVDINPERLEVDSQDRLYASAGVLGFVRYKKDHSLDYKCTAHPMGYVVPHASGLWGYGHFVNATLATIDLTSCTSNPSFLDPKHQVGPFSLLETAAFDGDTILIAGSSTAANGQKQIYAFDKAGNEKFHFGGVDLTREDRFGWVHAISLCKKGICVLDSNSRRISVWDRQGKKHLGNVPLKTVLGLAYGWHNDFVVTKRGAFIVAGHERDVKNVNEGLIYRLNGL